jgi:hypothetical protein
MRITAGRTYLGQRGTVTWRPPPECCGPGTRNATDFSFLRRHRPAGSLGAVAARCPGGQIHDGNLPASELVPVTVPGEHQLTSPDY